MLTTKGLILTSLFCFLQTVVDLKSYSEHGVPGNNICGVENFDWLSAIFKINWREGEATQLDL